MPTASSFQRTALVLLWVSRIVEATERGIMSSENLSPRVTRKTYAVSDALFRQVYDSPHSLPGKERWITTDNDVRAIEKLLEIPSGAIGAPLWVSGDTRRCRQCDRETNWLDIISSALSRTHSRNMLIAVILGNKKFVNTEVPDAIPDLTCYACGANIHDLRSFKCHNWAYARADLLQLVTDEPQVAELVNAISA